LTVNAVLHTGMGIDANNFSSNTNSEAALIVPNCDDSSNLIGPVPVSATSCLVVNLQQPRAALRARQGPECFVKTVG